MNKTYSCNICGSNDFRDGVIKSGYRYVICSSCNVASLYPLPSDEELKGLYEDFKDLVCDGVAQGCHFSPEYRDAYFKEKDLDFKDIGYTFKDGAKALDIGCADGIFLRYLLARHNIKGEGIDVSEKMVKSACDDGFICSTRQIHEIAGPYDMASMWDSIEHLRSPVDMLNEVYRILGPSGDLIIQTPCRGVLSDEWGGGGYNTSLRITCTYLILTALRFC